jgi:hypothetical protein
VALLLFCARQQTASQSFTWPMDDFRVGFLFSHQSPLFIGLFNDLSFMQRGQVMTD